MSFVIKVIKHMARRFPEGERYFNSFGESETKGKAAVCSRTLRPYFYNSSEVRMLTHPTAPIL